MQHAAMDANLADIERRLQNMIRLGTVSEVDYGDPPRVRVQSGKLLTDWLQWGAGRAGETRKWDPITIGEQVVILSPGGDMAAGLVFPAIYSSAFPAPSNSPTLHTTHYPDNAVVEYEHKEHALRVILPDNGTVTVKASTVTIDAPNTHITGDVTVDKDVVASGISLVHHKHGGVLPGPAKTGVPT